MPLVSSSLGFSCFPGCTGHSISYYSGESHCVPHKPLELNLRHMLHSCFQTSFISKVCCILQLLCIIQSEALLNCKGDRPISLQQYRRYCDVFLVTLYVLYYTPIDHVLLYAFFRSWDSTEYHVSLFLEGSYLNLSIFHIHTVDCF